MAKKVKKTTKKTARKKASTSRAKAGASKSAKKKAVTKTAKKKTTKKTQPKKALKTKKKTSRKTAVKRKKTTRRRVGGSRVSALTAKEIEGFRRLLLEKRAELLGDVSYIENEALRKSRLDNAGDLSSMPIHMADIGTDNFEQEFALGLMDSERKILVEISAALRRIDEGEFGICEGTGRPIPKARLRANPWARYCVEYATMVEKGLVVEGERLFDEEGEEDFEDLGSDSGEYEIIDEDMEEAEDDFGDTGYGTDGDLEDE